jgi:hypothetical protein
MVLLPFFVERSDAMNEYPKDLYANAILFEGKIVRWSVGPSKRTPETISWRGEIPNVFEKLHNGLITSEHKKIIVNNEVENNHAFEVLAPQWFSQFEISEYNKGAKPY